MKDNGNGTATISCPDGTTVNVSNGADGTEGATGAAGSPGTAGAPGTAGTPGVAGTSCSVAVNPDAGTKVVTCTDGTSVTLYDGVTPTQITNFATLSAFELGEEDFTVTVNSVSNVAKPVVQLMVKDRKGLPVKNIPAGNFGGIALLQLVPGNIASGGNGLANDTWISHIANCATCTSSSETASSTTLVDNGDGSYVYTFARDVITPKTLADGGVAIAGVAFDANAVHRFAVRLGASGNPYRPVDATYDYIPATGVNVDGQNDKVQTSNCLSCHNQWRANAKNLGGTTPFHSGQRYDVRYCVVCHNSQRKYSGNIEGGNAVIAEPIIDGSGNMTPPTGRTNIAVLRGQAIIDMPVFAHKIHAGEHLTLKGNYAGLGTEINEFTFPQDVRNCAKCHSGAAKADNWKLKPSRRACGACHDNVNFETGAGHSAGNISQQDDALCFQCHGPTATYSVEKMHLALVAPDPTSTYAGGTNPYTNASYIGNTQNPPPGARVFAYDIKSVTAVDAGAGLVSPSVTFRFTENDAGVAFNAAGGSSTELLDNFVGSPAVYCSFAMPQDGQVAPADFNASSNVYLRSAWNGTATTGNSASTMTGPDSVGYYTVTINGTKLPPEATLLTCGLGYTYALASTQPLTQTNLAAYPYNTGNKTGGISMPAKNVWRVATGYTGRRGATAITSATGQIVQTSRCAECHNQLGVSPTYHAGQRNDGATCAFCHTPNTTSSGWTAGSQSFIHAIHAAKKRAVPYNWHAVAAATGEGQATGFWGVDYPGRLHYCESCHQPGYYDFSASWYTTGNGVNLSRRTVQTVARGTYDAVTPTADGGVPSLAISVSPYVDSSGATNYGNGYSYDVASRTVTPAALTTLVISPIANTCFGCHDTDPARLHMESNGATIYGTRSAAQGATEQCMICHGPGKLAAIKAVHYQ